MSYITEVENKKFVGNVVIRMIGQYFAIRQPDSGLVIPDANNMTIKDIVVNPTQVDLKRVSQTIASYSFRIVDKAGVITAITGDRADALLNQDVEIWIGRTTGSFAFSDYFKLPITKIRKVSHDGNDYSFSTNETTDRMNKPIFNLQNKLSGSILSGTTIFTVQDDLSTWPTSGMGKLDNEFFSWTGVDLTLNQLTGVVRGEKTTIPVAHDLGTTIYWVYDVTENPINIFLQLLISGGGGGVYDVLPSGLGISENLIDINALETLRDFTFASEQYQLTLYNISDTLKFLEEEILLSCNLRLITTDQSKIGLALLDQSVFAGTPNAITEDDITSYPKWEVDYNKIINNIVIQWDYNETTQVYENVSPYSDADSIAAFGESKPYELKFKGIRASLDGQDIVDDRAFRLLERFKTANPEISFKSHLAKHLINVGDKVLVSSSELPSATGTLQFATELEVISRAINFITGDVNFRLAYTSYSGIRGCYIAPSDRISTVINQKTITVPAGRGAYYTVGWKMRLYDRVGIVYFADLVNEIVSIVGDTITFQNDFVTTLVPSVQIIRFAEYDDATQDQHRYCFVAPAGNNFNDGSAPYRVLF